MVRIRGGIDEEVAELLDIPKTTYECPACCPILAKKIEEGKAFSTSHRESSLASGSYFDVYFENPSSSDRLVYIVAVIVNSKAEGDVDVYDNVSVTTSGTALTVRNLNLGSTNASVVNVETGGAYDTTGAKLVSTSVFAGGSRVRAIGGVAEVGETVIIPPGYNILIRVTNTSGSASDYSVRIIWWEE